MMEETGEREISFTWSGDREVVKYNFYKMCFSLFGDLSRGLSIRDSPSMARRAMARRKPDGVSRHCNSRPRLSCRSRRQ